MGKNQQYAEMYAEYAMEQMKRYGIPASVTLAQGILESSNGQSELSRLGNNHFGIKATNGWLKDGGEYLVYTDDRPDEKFCKYTTVGDSFEHHSKFLKENSRYAACFSLSPDDYKGWTEGIANAGYASGRGYAASLQKIIEMNGLQKYDRQVMKEMKVEGRTFGVENNALSNGQLQAQGTQAAVVSSSYSFPMKRDEFLFVTSAFGMRQDPMDEGRQQMHKGIDIRCRQDNVLATESNGKVVAVNQNANATGGKSVTVEYNHADGSKIQCVYMHLDNVSVKVGDEVNAGQKLGVSGNTGSRTTGEHLHFGVKSISADGQSRDIDPAAYLADIAQRGNIQIQALHNGNDLLAKYNTEQKDVQQENLSPENWMKKLLSSEDSGVGLSASNDPILDMAMTLFSSLMMLAIQIDNKSEEEQKGAISYAANQRAVDLTSLVPGMKNCNLAMTEKGKAILTADNGAVQIKQELSSAELSRLNVILGSQTLTDEAKRLRVAGMVNTIVLSQQASQNFEQKMSEQQGQEQNIRR